MDRRPNRRNKAAFSNFSSLKSVFDKFSFSDGLVWTVGLTRRKKNCVFKFLRRSVDYEMFSLQLPARFV